jgi:hypothetical protein
MPISLPILTVVFAVAGFALFVAAIAALRRRRPFSMLLRLTMAIALLALGGLAGVVGVAIQGYRAFTREDVAARVRVEPIAPQRFSAHFRFADGREATYVLAGDELYVDAHVLKWTPFANFLGLHTAYELDRVAGRYHALAEERDRPRTVHALTPERALDLFTLRRRYTLLAPLLDAEYGSASFVPAGEPAELELRVTTSGLLIRRLEAESSPLSGSESVNSSSE